MERPLYAITAGREPAPAGAERLQGETRVSGALSGEAFSLRGRSHVISGEPLQDSCALVTLPNGWLMAAVADGVGSEARAEVGSFIAAEAVTSFCARFWGTDTAASSVLDLLCAGYKHAYGCIALRARNDDRPLHEYGTTLHAAVFSGSKVYYGHAGDGGLLVMDSQGSYHNCTEPQKGQDGESVVTLLAGSESWEFGVVEDVISAMLMTDGVYDKLASKALKRFWNGVDNCLASWFLSPWGFDRGNEALTVDLEALAAAFGNATPNAFYPRLARAIAQGEDEEGAQRFVAEHVLQGNRPLRTLQEIQDDISVAILMDTSRKPDRRPWDDYRPPDWADINRRIASELYGRTGEASDENTGEAAEEEPAAAERGGGTAGDRADDETPLPEINPTDPELKGGARRASDQRRERKDLFAGRAALCLGWRGICLRRSGRRSQRRGEAVSQGFGHLRRGASPEGRKDPGHDGRF